MYFGNVALKEVYLTSYLFIIQNIKGKQTTRVIII